MKRSLIAAGAAATLSLAAFAPAANAQNTDAVGVLDLVGVLEQGVAEADCDGLEFVLAGLNLVDEDTTRGELASDLRDRLGGEIALQLLGAGTINAIADRALECEIVEEDPQTLPAGSSEILDVVTLLSS